MRRFKAFIILIICVLLIATIGKLTFAEDSRTEINVEELLKTGVMHFNNDEMKTHSNIHCVQRGKSFKRGNFKITATAKISGDKVTLINYGKGEVGETENWNYPIAINETTIEVKGSNILAAILTTANFSHGYYLTEEEKRDGNRENGNRSDAQLAIWYYWNIWSKSLPETDGVNWQNIFPYYLSNEAPINSEDKERLNTYYEEGSALVKQGVFEAYDKDNANMKIKDYPYIKNNDGEYEIPENGIYKENDKRYRKVSSGAKELASGHEYNVTIHLMQFYSYGNLENDNTESNKEYNEAQSVIVYESGPAIKKLSLEKIWDDGENKFQTRPDSITAQITAYKMNDTTNEYEEMDVHVYKENEDGSLYVDENGDYELENKGKTYEVELSKNNNWYDEIRVLAKYNETQLIYYGIKEVEVDGYELDKAECYRMYNNTRINMEKPDFMADDEIVGTMWNAYIELTNKLKDEVNVKAIKVWEDKDDLDGYRPNSITVKLKANGNLTDKKATLSENNNWTYTFENLDRYKKVKGEWFEVNYTVVEDEIKVGNKTPYEELPHEKVVTEATETAPKTITYKITNKHEPYYDGYYEIKGKVWCDGHATKGNAINGTLGPEDVGIPGIKVTLMYGESAFYSDERGNVLSSTTTTANGEYTIKVNYDNSSKVYKLYENKDVVTEKLSDGKAWVMFEYDGMVYTTVRCDTELKAENTSKAREYVEGKANEERRYLDESYYKVNTSTPEIEYYNQEIEGTNKTIPAIDYKENSYWKKAKLEIKATTQGIIKSFTDYKFKNTDNGGKTRKEKETIRYCDGDRNGDGIEEYIKTNPTGAWNTIENGTHDCTNCHAEGHAIKEFEVEVTTINGVNLGLFEREQPEVGIFSDLSKVQVEMNGQKYTYLYGVRGKDFVNADIKTQFQNKDEYTYQRPVNPADIAFIQEETNKDAMSVWITYEIEVGNLSTTLPITVENIINVYDLGYNKPTITIKQNEKTVPIEYTTSNIYGSKEERGFNEITLNNLGLTIQPGSRSDKIQITYEVSKEEIRGLFDGNASLHNAVEIHTYSTTYGESTLRAEEQVGVILGYNEYAGYDYETHPGNAAIKKETVTYNNQYETEILKSDKNLVEYVAGKLGPERDTDISPSFILCKDDEPKILSGTVFEDTADNTTDRQRLGDGKYDSANENVIQNVKVELFKVNEDGNATLAKLYKDNGESGDAIVYSKSDGSYAFEGVVTSEYFIKFTYGNDVEKELKDATTIIDIIDGGETTINARNHKSTIITSPVVKEIFGLNYENEDFDKKWHINIEDNYSVAVDNMKDRLEIEDLQNSNFGDGENMTAYSKPFATQIEFESTGKAQTDADGEVASNVLSNLDFGIIERPREDIFIQKRITNLKITLANGQVLTEGNPSGKTLNYVKSMGQGQIFENSKEAKDFERRILVEMDTELIQGSQLEVGYEVVVKNNNEKDYDYGTLGDYADIVDNNYISKSSKANYYYYGIKDELQELKATIEIVDYLNNDVVYDKTTEGIWEEKQLDNLKRDGLISIDTSKALEEGKKYRIFKLAANEGKITLARGETSEVFTMSASKRLANKDENIYDNHVEIIKIDAKSARTIGTNEKGETIEKAYIPGDYVPTLDSEHFETQNSQQDDDKVSVILTNATGITNYVITYLITGLIGLIVLVIGIAVMKKVLAKK